MSSAGSLSQIVTIGGTGIKFAETSVLGLQELHSSKEGVAEKEANKTRILLQSH